MAPPREFLRVYATPRSALVPASSDADELRKMKRKLRIVAVQGGLVSLCCGLGAVGGVTGSFDPDGTAAAATDPARLLVLGALALGALSGLLGTATALFGSSMVAHWIERTLEDEASPP